MPTLLVTRGGFLFDFLKTHFDNIWDDPELSKPNRERRNT